MPGTRWPTRVPCEVTITIIIAYMVIAGYQFKGGGRFISILSEGSISPETGMLIAAFLIVGFTVLCTSDFIPTVYFGVLVSLSMIGGLLGNLVVLPLLLRLAYGRRNSPVTADSD